MQQLLHTQQQECERLRQLDSLLKRAFMA